MSMRNLIPRPNHCDFRSHTSCSGDSNVALDRTLPYHKPTLSQAYPIISLPYHAGNDVEQLVLEGGQIHPKSPDAEEALLDAELNL